ncbi:MAG: M43 family zinc metalloprotease [Bacteroidota bacterium]
MKAHNHYTHFSVLFIFLCFSATSLIAQQPSSFGCRQKHLHEDRLQQDEKYAKKQAQLSKWIYQKSTIPNREKSNEVHQIPVVIHIIHLSAENSEAEETSNPTNAQIRIAMEHLNEAFRNTGNYAADGRGANDSNNPDADLLKSVDVGIEFCLAQRDINDEATSGILRYESDEFSNLDETEDDAMKAWVAEQNGDRFPTTDYANVYLVNEICDEGDCGTAGYAYLAGAHGRPFDGIVNEAFWFGTQPEFSTVHIHEFGHYFDLYHTFEEGCTNDDCLLNGDLICDTPPDDAQEPIACESSENSCNTDMQSGPFSIDQEDLYENYMDYSNSRCNNTFTQGQKDRMRLALEGIRSSLLSSKGCIPLSDEEVALAEIVVPNGSICTNDFQPMIRVENLGTAAITSLSIESTVDGGNAVITDWEGTIGVGEVEFVPLEMNSVADFGTYEFCANILSVNNVADAFMDNNSACANFAYQNPVAELEYCDKFDAAASSLITLQSPAGTQDVLEIADFNTCEDRGAAIMLNTWQQNIPKDGVAKIRLPILDLSEYDNPSLHFHRAYARSFSNTNTLLQILASKDCGLTFDTLYNKTSFDLSTRPSPEVDTWQPKSCNEWAMDSVLLIDYAGEASLQLVFEMSVAPTESAFSDWGNNLYLDDICVRGEICTPLVVNNLNTDFCDELSLTVNNEIEEEEQIGWLISREALIPFESKMEFEQYLNQASLEGDVLMDEVVLLASSEDNKNLKIPSPCSQLSPEETLFVTPFLSENLAEIRDVTINYEDGDYLDGLFNDSLAFLYQTDFPLPGVPPVIVNDPVFTITIEVTDYQSDSTDIQFFFQQNNTDLSLTLQEALAQQGNVGTYVFENADLEGFDPKFGFRIWAFSEANIDFLEWNVTIDIFYKGRAGSTFPSIVNFNNCTIGESIEVSCECEESCALEVAEVLQEAISSCGGNDGRIEIVVNSEANLEYSLDGENWQASPIFENLASGTYLPQIRDADNTDCTAQAAEVILDAPVAPSITNFEAEDVSDCGGLDGQIEVSLLEESEEIEYSLDGENWQIESVFEGLFAGNYDVFVRNVNATNCRDSVLNIEINMPSTPNILEPEIIPVSDCGEEDAILRISTDFDPTEYSLDGENWQASNEFTDLPPSNYFVHVRNANAPSCRTISDFLSILPPNVPDIEDIENVPPSQCGASDGQITIFTDDVAAYEFSIDSGRTWQTSNLFANLSEGDFALQIRVTDSPNCLSEIQNISSSPSNPIDFVVSISSEQETLCKGEMLLFSINISNGVAPYTITYTNGEEVFLLEDYQSGDDIETLFEDATTYEVLSIIDANGCTGEVLESVSFNLGGDECRFATFKGNISTEDGRALADARIELLGDRNEVIMTDEQGDFSLEKIDIEGKYELQISYEGTHILNGLSAFDLQLISRHILNNRLLDSPYKLLAADINNSGSITNADIIELRKILLEIDDKFANNPIWRFMPVQTQSLEANDATSFELQFKDLKPGAQNLNIIAVKIGDVNLSSRLP